MLQMQQRGNSAPVTQPVFVIVDVQPKELGVPTKAYVTVEEVSEDGKETTLRFQHIPSEIGALEAEEVGVEHLLRYVPTHLHNNPSVY
jgi:26S proteasome regulatory subunit N8